MDPFLQQIFISRKLCPPTFVLGTGDVTVNTETVSLLKKGGESLIPLMFNVNPLHLLPPKSSAKSTLLANVLEMNLREEMGGHRVLLLGWNEAKPEILPEGHTCDLHAC